MEDKRKMAAALQYDSTKGEAPQVLAVGYGELAERIVKSAREAGVPVHEDRELARLLVGLDLQQEIPVELYRAVAAVLAVILATDKSKEGGSL